LNLNCTISVGKKSGTLDKNSASGPSPAQPATPEQHQYHQAGAFTTPTPGNAHEDRPPSSHLPRSFFPKSKSREELSSPSVGKSTSHHGVGSEWSCGNSDDGNVVDEDGVIHIDLTLRANGLTGGSPFRPFNLSGGGMAVKLDDLFGAAEGSDGSAGNDSGENGNEGGGNDDVACDERQGNLDTPLWDNVDVPTKSTSYGEGDASGSAGNFQHPLHQWDWSAQNPLFSDDGLKVAAPRNTVEEDSGAEHSIEEDEEYSSDEDAFEDTDDDLEDNEADGDDMAPVSLFASGSSATGVGSARQSYPLDATCSTSPVGHDHRYMDEELLPRRAFPPAAQDTSPPAQDSTDGVAANAEMPKHVDLNSAMRRGGKHLSMKAMMQAALEEESLAKGKHNFGRIPINSDEELRLHKNTRARDDWNDSIVVGGASGLCEGSGDFGDSEDGPWGEECRNASSISAAADSSIVQLKEVDAGENATEDEERDWLETPSRRRCVGTL